MDILVLSWSHIGLSFAASLALVLNKTRHLAFALAAFAASNIILMSVRAWDIETAVSFVGPMAAVVAASLTLGASIPLTLALAAPIVGVCAWTVAHGIELGAHGIAWSLAATNGYAALVGLVLLAIGAHQVSRYVALCAGLMVATSAPTVVGWVCRAIGHSVRSATVLDCVFLAAIVVASVVEWIPRCQISWVQRSQARFSGR